VHAFWWCLNAFGTNLRLQCGHSSSDAINAADALLLQTHYSSKMVDQNDHNTSIRKLMSWLCTTLSWNLHEDKCSSCKDKNCKHNIHAWVPATTISCNEDNDFQ
jgi:hypothetical protein